MIELIALSSAATTIYLFTAGRVYAVMRQTCKYCGQRVVFVKIRFGFYSTLQCPQCKEHPPDNEITRVNEWVVFLAILWPIWLLPAIIINSGKKNGLRSMAIETKKAQVNENV